MRMYCHLLVLYSVSIFGRMSNVIPSRRQNSNPSDPGAGGSGGSGCVSRGSEDSEEERGEEVEEQGEVGEDGEEEDHEQTAVRFQVQCEVQSYYRAF